MKEWLLKFLPESLVQNFPHWKMPTRHALRNRIEVLWVSLKRPHILLRLLIINVMIWVSAAYFLLPYIKSVESDIALRPGQWAQMENLIKLSNASVPQSGSIETLDEVGLQKVRAALAAKGIKPNILRLGIENPPRIELQVNDIPFSAVLDALEDLRITWRLYPERIELVSRSVVANVNLSTTLKQYGVTSDVLNSHREAGYLSR